MNKKAYALILWKMRLLPMPKRYQKWKIVFSYYACLHAIDTVILPQVGKISFSNHKERGVDYAKCNYVLLTSYKTLKGRSETVRYEPQNHHTVGKSMCSNTEVLTKSILLDCGIIY